ncbi:hypothetical protein Bca101_043836 [Brassica carinata]
MLPDGILYASTESHYSVFKAARMYRMECEKVHTLISGEIDCDDLRGKLLANKEKPAILNVNIGTTVKGAVDDLDLVIRTLEECGFSNDRFYIHCDGALFGLMMPFVKRAPKVTFNKPIGSVSVSGHKFVGCPMPCGVQITRMKHIKVLSSNAEYLASRDATIMGSRNGHAPLFLWYTLNWKGYKGFQKEVQKCLRNTHYLKDRLREARVSAMLNELSSTVVFERPKDEEFVRRWQLACQGDIAHVVVMPSVTIEKLDHFLKDLVDHRSIWCKDGSQTPCLAKDVGTNNCRKGNQTIAFRRHCLLPIATHATVSTSTRSRTTSLSSVTFSEVRKSLRLSKHPASGSCSSSQRANVLFRVSLYTPYTRQIVCADKHTLWPVFAGHPLRFGLQEFGTITGLPCGDFPPGYNPKTKSKSDPRKDAFWVSLIGKKRFTTIEDLRHQLATDRNMPSWRKVRLVVIIIVDGVLIAHKQKPRPTLRFVKLVQHLHVFFNHPWGRESFLKTITCMKHHKSAKRPRDDPTQVLVYELKQESYRLQGFPLALQLVAFAAVPKLLSTIQAPYDSLTIMDLDIDHLPMYPSIATLDIHGVEADPKLVVAALIPVESQSQPE